MPENVSMEGITPSDFPHEQLFEPSSFPTSSTNDVTDSHTDGSGWSLNDSGPSTPTHDHMASQSTRIGGLDVFHPYAIEEPDDEQDSPSDKPEPPRLPDYFETWQRDLADHMDDLGCESDLSSGANTSNGCTRGQKRKPGSQGGALHHHSSKSKIKSTETQVSGPGISPKRRRRRSRNPGDAAKKGHPVSFHDFREAQRSGSSSSELRSTDESSPEAMNESAITDEMEID